MTYRHLFFEGVPTRHVAPGVRFSRSPRRVPDEAEVETPELGRFFEAVLGPAGLPPEAYHLYALRRRVPACLRFLRVESVHEATQLLRERPELAPAALNVVLLGVSEFFRDPAVFDRLREAVLTPLLSTGRRRIRVWSAGCSMGQELYSVAMLLAELSELARFELVGSDCRAEAIASARRGVFPLAAIQGLPPDRASRFFTVIGESAAIVPDVREAVHWRETDLLAGALPGPWDLILWRNMSIYLTEPARRRVWGQVHAELAKGGWIVIGKADPVPADLPLTRVASGIYQKNRTAP